MPILVDGYNVLHQSGHLGRGRGPGFLERARHSLVRFIAGSLEPEEVGHTTIVFDSKHAPYGAAPQQIEHGITVMYAQGYEDADSLMEELIRRAPQPRLLLVVSSDRRVQQAAQRRRARVQGAEEWLDHLERARRLRQHSAEPPREKPSEPTTAEEVDYWRNLFEDEEDGC